MLTGSGLKIRSKYIYKMISRLAQFVFYLILILRLSDARCQYLINYYTPFKYYPATEEPDTNWYMPGFDDSLWSQDTGRIGYGNIYQDVTVDEGTVSLYLRYRFNISDKSAGFCSRVSKSVEELYVLESVSKTSKDPLVKISFIKSRTS